jgi:hypothetical protein
MDALDVFVAAVVAPYVPLLVLLILRLHPFTSSLRLQRHPVRAATQTVRSVQGRK